MPILNLYGREVNMEPGDRYDMEKNGLLVWYTGDEAIAMRILHQVRSRELARTIDFVEHRCHLEAELRRKLTDEEFKALMIGLNP